MADAKEADELYRLGLREISPQIGGSNAQNEEGEEECGFCIFMKGGGCKESFTDWSNCVDQHREGSKDFTEECKDATLALQDCMMEHKDYYKDFIGLADNAEGDQSKDQENSKVESKDSSEKGNENSQNGKSDSSGKSEKANDDDSQSEEKGSEEGSKSGDSGSSKSSRLENTPAEKHDEASKDSESKQARTHEQETNPVKAKPDHGKKEEAANQPPKPDREENRQEASKEEESNDGDGKDEEEEEEDDKPHIEIGTAPYDRRFVTTNQARHCYTRYQEFHKCAGEKGEDDKDCSFFRKAYRAICPGDWVDNWNEQREAGTFPGRY